MSTFILFILSKNRHGSGRSSLWDGMFTTVKVQHLMEGDVDLNGNLKFL